MAKEPGDRFQTITELRDELRNLLHDISIADDPQFREEVGPIAPMHLAASRSGHPLWRVTSIARLSRRNVLVASLALLAMLVIPPLIWFAARSKPSAIVSGEGVVLRLHGSNTIGAKLAPALAEEFLKQLGANNIRTSPGSNPEEITVEGFLPGNGAPTTIEIRSHGSATAFTDLAEGKNDIGLSSRKITPEEVQKLSALGDMTSSASEHILALDGIAVIVNRDNSVDALTKEQIAKIFSGEIDTWGQLQGRGGAIKVYARDARSGTFDSFKALVLGKAELVKGAIRFEDSNALSDAVARDLDGIGFIGLPYVRDAKAVAVAEGDAPPLLPNRLTVSTEDYILSRRLYLYTPTTQRSNWINKFVDFALSNPGQSVVASSGFVAQNIQPETAQVAMNAPAEYKQLTKGAERLSLNFRFRRGGKDLDNKARLDLDRVVSFVSDLRFSGQNILLFGFADDDKGTDANIELSRERALLVAEQFKRRGITPAVVTGFGSQIPVALSSTEDGKEKNRRVELWLKR